jgi:acrylyl-CoA reductase (NADPH)
MQNFRAFRVHSEDKKISTKIDEIGIEDLSEGEVVVKVEYSGVNYKDALAGTGTGRIMRRFPMVAGIDLAGTVESSTDPEYAPGDAIVAVGAGLSEEHDGGYAQYARLKSEMVVKRPASLSAREAMAIGTAGFTAALALVRMEDNGLVAANGPVLINGATGGVGSIAIDIFSARGYEVVALTGKQASVDYLRGLGAKDVLIRGELEMGSRPLERSVYAGAVDNLGGEVLSWMLRSVHQDGSVASIGLAADHSLATSVMPFILRGVNLLGINSVIMSNARRREVWRRLGDDLKPKHLEQIVTNEVDLDGLAAVLPAYIEGGVTGRTLVRIA